MSEDTGGTSTQTDSSSSKLIRTARCSRKRGLSPLREWVRERPLGAGPPSKTQRLALKATFGLERVRSIASLRWSTRGRATESSASSGRACASNVRCG